MIVGQDIDFFPVNCLIFAYPQAKHLNINTPYQGRQFEFNFYTHVGGTDLFLDETLAKETLGTKLGLALCVDFNSVLLDLLDFAQNTQVFLPTTLSRFSHLSVT